MNRLPCLSLLLTWLAWRDQPSRFTITLAQNKGVGVCGALSGALAPADGQRRLEGKRTWAGGVKGG